MRGGRGFTLIELLAAMAILAVVSVMAVQALSGALFQRSVLARVDDDGARLIRTLTLLRRDLESVVPMLARESEGRVQGILAQRPNTMALPVAGLQALPGAPAFVFGAVIWGINPQGELVRALVDDAAIGGPGLPPSEVMLPAALALRLEGVGGPLHDIDDLGFLPPGLAVTLETADYGTIRIVVAR